LTPVKNIYLNSPEEVINNFNTAIEKGYEGLILKHPNGYYKYGRATVKQGLMYKIKPFNTYDLIVLGVKERLENINESIINELGYKKKNKTINGGVPTGIASCFSTKYKDEPLDVTITGTEAFRRDIWENKESYIGRIIEVKAMELGSKKVLRHPTFVRFRDDKK
ncbi:MAG: hypothetical protein ACOCRK_11230, partial [bacterium]